MAITQAKDLRSRGKVQGSRACGPSFGVCGFWKLAMPPAKRPACGRDEDDDGDEDDARQRASRVGFKDSGRLCEALSPFVNQRIFTNYPPDRDIKSMDKKKLTSTWVG